jgi:hypothetical protein
MTNNGKRAEFDGSVDRHLLKLINFRNNAINLMFEVKDHNESGIYIEDISGNDKSLQKLKTNLNWLLMNYWVKNKYTKKEIEYIDEDIKNKVEDSGPVPTSDELDFEECQRLLYGIIEMMEDLGHTKYESDKTGRTTV